MIGGHWNINTFIRLTCYSLVLAGVASESVRPPPPTLEIIKKGNNLYFHASSPRSTSPQCWQYVLLHRKCNEKPDTITVTKEDNWIAKVEYDAACKYTAQVQAKYDTTYCGEGEHDSDMSEPVYFGRDGDPNLPFKVAVIIIPVIVCACLIIAIVLFWRNKEKFLPKIPSPSHFFKEMYDSKNELTKGLYATELYVPNEEVVDELHVEPNTTLTSQILASETT